MPPHGKRQHLANVVVVIHTTERGKLVLSATLGTHDPYDKQHYGPREQGVDYQPGWEELLGWMEEAVYRCAIQNGRLRPPPGRDDHMP